MEWIFEGIGTELLSLILGLITGGFAGYRLAIKNTEKNVQKARDNATQIQGGINGK